MTQKTMNSALLILALLAAGLCALPAMAQTGEGYDPMRQITTQIARPNLLIVLDDSGSMVWDINGTSVGVDGTGSVPTAKWARTTSSTGCTGKLKYTYTLTLSQAYPSRATTVKNVLGNSVTIITPYTPGNQLAIPVPIPANNPNWVGITPTFTPTLANPNTWVWKWTGTACLSADPGIPINMYDVTGVLISVVGTTYNGPVSLTSLGPEWGTGGTSLPPSDVVGINANQVNWGLETFSGDIATCLLARLPVYIDSTDTGIVTTLENQLRLQSAGGLNFSGGTPTIGGLVFAKSVLQTTYSGGSITDSGGTKYTLAADQKALCDRFYGVILVTDGLSNTCNPSGGNWADPCTATHPCPGSGCPDGGSSGFTCPSTPANFAAGKAEDIWNLTIGSKRLNARTFVIGVSNAVGPCELNYTAYKGRTDAHSPNNDAGVGLVTPLPAFPTAPLPKDCYLPGAVAASCLPASSPGPGNYNAPTCPSETPPHGDYAYFATSATALYDAFADIIAGAGTGNYTTAAPSVASSSPTTSGSLGLLPSMEYPSWKGHLYGFDLSRCVLTSCTLTSANCTGCPDCTRCTGTVAAPVPAPPQLIWDAGEVLSRADSASPPPPVHVGSDHTDGRAIYTWNPSTANSLVEVTRANAATLNTICGTCGMTANVVDFIRGNDGTCPNPPSCTPVKRAWLLGSSVNSTAAIVQGPSHWTQGTLPNHAVFEDMYSTRHALVWVGSDDDMLHAFDVVDGAEVIALIPPELLKGQIQLYNNFTADHANVVGQKPSILEHIYGVASSPRFADVNVGTTGSPDYRTLLLLSEGAGFTYEAGKSFANCATCANAITAIDVTHPYPHRTSVAIPSPAPGVVTPQDFDPDPNYASANPVSIRWRYPRAGANPLNTTWSLSAMGANSTSSWVVGLGSGFKNTNVVQGTPNNSFQPSIVTLDAVTGNANVDTPALPAPAATGNIWVGNQNFADCSLWQRGALHQKEDNIFTEMVEADLNGHLWTKSFSTLSNYTGNNAADQTHLDAGLKQPIYYSPAIATYTDALGVRYAIYAYSSGSFYERSPNVTGPNAGTSGNFIPTAYVCSARLDNSFNPISWQSTAFPLKNIPIAWNNATPPAITAYAGPKTQVTSSPLLVVPTLGSGLVPYVLFLIYDPQAGSCAGTSYIVQGFLDTGGLTGGAAANNGTGVAQAGGTAAGGANLGTAGAPGGGTGIGFGVSKTSVTSVGEGASSGFTVAGNQIYVAHSETGSGATPEFKPTGKSLVLGTQAVTPNWWIELQ